MLSRLSGLANTVLHELSGEGDEAGIGALPAGPESEPSQQNGEETPEDMLERLTHMEKLVVQLKDLLREKEAQLQQKDAVLQEERQAADAKLAKLKLQAKAKVASLNKRMEELKEQGAAQGLPQELPPPPPQPQCDQETHKKQEEEVAALQRKLQEQESLTGELQRQLEEATGSVEEAQAQLSLLQEVIQEKDAHLEEQAHQHQAELHQLAAQSDLEAEMQQNLRLLQRKLEEQEAALLGRTQVVELLQHELNGLEEQKQVLLEKFHSSEAELESLKRASASERQQSQSFVEKLEMELAERKLACHDLQETVQQISQELTRASATEEAREQESRDAAKRHLEELEEKTQQIAQLQRAEQDLRSSYDALLAENSRLRQDVDRTSECSAKQVSIQPGELPEGPPELDHSQDQPEMLAVDTLELVSTLEEPPTEQEKSSLPKRESQPEDEQQKTAVEKLDVENESLHAKLALLEDQLEFSGSTAEPSQVSCANADTEVSARLLSGVSSSFVDGCSGPGDSLDGVGNLQVGCPDSAAVPATLAELSPGEMAEEPPAEGNGHPDLLQYLSAKKRKDLSVLLLELQEAQEEIAFLKGQLPDSGGPSVAGETPLTGKPLASSAEGGGRGEEAGLSQGHSSRSSLMTAEAPALLGLVTEPGSLPAEGSRATPEPSLASASQAQEPGKEAGEGYGETFRKQAAEIERLQQLLADSGATLATLTSERDQLLSQLKELCCLAELKEQVRQLEGDLADAEKRRLSEYESGISQLGLLKEQIQSLRNEAGSKDLKIEALQRDLDDTQRQLAEQDLLASGLRTQLHEEQQAGHALAGRLQEASTEVVELSRSLLTRDSEADRLQELVEERSAQVELLQQAVEEREQQLAEVSTSMADRLVQLNEEKFVLGQELVALQKQLDRPPLQANETRDPGVDAGPEPGPWAEGGLASAGEEEPEALRKENEHLRKKLQAALRSRKELRSKIRRAESEGAQPEAPKALEGKASAGGGEPPQVRADAGAEEAPGSQGPVASLSRSPSAQEAELQSLGQEKDSAVAELQAVIAELRQSLQEKDVLLGALAAEGEAHKKQQAPESCPSDSGPEGEQRSALEEKIGSLEQEKEQLQKKLQETLASRKDTLKKAQEKDRHHREQLKQQKDDYSLLQEQFAEQSREKERMHHQLQRLQAQVEMLESPSVPEPAAPPEGAQQGPVLGGELPAASEMGNSGAGRAEGMAVERLKAELEELRAGKGELEAQLHSLEAELQSKSDAAQQLQEEVRHLQAETEAARTASQQAEASMRSLRAELEESRAELARMEGQVSLAEQKELASKGEIEALSLQLAEKTESLQSLQAQLREQEEALQGLQGRLELQAKERAPQPQAEPAETQQKPPAEDPSKVQLQRKLQAALISRKDVLRENRSLQEELASTRAALEEASHRLRAAEGKASALEEEKGTLLKKLEAVAEEREKLIAEVDKALVENQSLFGSCESLKLALEGVTCEKAQLERDLEALRSSQAEELSEWQGKLQELQKEYETLLQSYENVSNEAERIRRVVEGVRQEKQELFLRLKGAEAEKREGEARLQGAEQEMEGMREKMRKFAKAKQQKILELEEENERLRAEEGGPRREGELSTSLREELERSRENSWALSSQLEALLAEKDSLRQELCALEQKLQGQAGETGESVVPGKAMAEEEAAPEVEEGKAEPAKAPEPVSRSVPPPEEEEDKAGPLREEIKESLRQVAQLTERVAQLEEARRVEAEKLDRVLAEADALGEEKKGLEEKLAAKGQELDALQEKALRAEQAQRQAEEQLAGMAGLKAALEAEKDDLEERLMNQLAELNGSIGNYQQDAMDLQAQNRQLLQELEALRGALSRLEDERRHLLREKAAAEAEKKETVEKLRSAWKGEGGRRAQARELQELLKEKQQEVRQLQKDCIKSQEKISDLERTVKALDFVQSESQKELEAAKRSLAKAGDDAKKAQAELSSCRVLLDDTQSEAARVLAESLKAKEELRAQLRHREEELERRLEEEKGEHAKEARNAQEKLEACRREQALSEGALRSLQEAQSQKDQDAQQLQGSLNQALAQLAAFSRSMSSLQDDRDRVIDKAREWERKFSEAIEKKEQEVRAQQEACSALEGRLRQAAAQGEELRSQVTSLEHSKLAGEASSQRALQRLQEEVELLRQQNGTLTVQLEEARQLLSDSQNQIHEQHSELQGLRAQLAEVQDSFAACKEEREEAESTVKRQEASLRERTFRQEQLEADLRSSKELTDRLHEEVSSQEQRIVGLLAAREEAVAAALSESRQQHKEELKEMESRIARGEEERTALQGERRKALEKADDLLEKLKDTREESQKHKAQLDSFSKAMSSLQDDRDRVLGDYRQLEQRHVASMLEKDQLIQEAAAENNSLKEEIRGLHGRMDDLHAENAKLDAELIRYREDLTQLISVKDSQQKQLSRAQQERIQALEQEKVGAEGRWREAEQAAEALQQDKHELEQEVKALQASLSQLQESGPVLELQARLQAKADEVQELSRQLSLSQQQAAALEEELALMRQAVAQQLQEAEARMKAELRSLHHDAGLMRNETETAEERVAELAKDLLEMEQNLLAATEENQNLKAQLQSFGKAMSSLQDSRDRSNEQLRAAEKKHAADLAEQQSLVRSLREEKAVLQEEQGALARERAALASQLAALQASAEEKGLLGQQLQAREAELLRLTSELEGASSQVKAFSKAMGSLQDERDRLLSELDKSHREHEVRLQSAPGASISLAEAQSLKKALSSLQKNREQLLAELKSLQQQAGADRAELARLKAQLQEQKQDAEQQLRQELQRLREEKAAWELGTHEQPLSHVQTAVRGTKASLPPLDEEQLQRQVPPEATSQVDVSSREAERDRLQAQLGSSLKELHQKEQRIQQLHSKLSQVFEEKNTLTLQLRGSSRSLRESQQRYSDVLVRCEALEKQLQQQSPGKDLRAPSADTAPGAPQERNEHPRESYTPELQELQMKLSEARQQENSTKQGLLRLEELLREEREQRQAAEEAFSAAQDHIRRLESSKWAPSLETSIDVLPAPEHALLVGSMEGTFSKPRQSTGPRRLLRSLFCSRTRLPLLATVYLLTVHVLLLLCFTGHL